MSNMSNSLTSGLKKAFFVIIALLSASTTFLYFTTTFGFGREMLGDELLTQILTGAWGVIVLDLAAIIWLRIYLNGSDNNALRSIAVVGMVIGLVGSALTSFAYIVSSSNSVTLPPTLAEGSVWALAAITVAHFVLAFLSGYKSTSAQIDERTASMLSEATDEMLILTEQMFRDSIPTLAEQNARQLQQLLAGRFASLTAFGQAQAPQAQQIAAPPTPADALPQPPQPRRTRSLNQLIDMLSQVCTEDALHDYDATTHRDVKELNSSDYEEWHKAHAERMQLLSEYGRLDELGASGSAEAAQAWRRRWTHGHGTTTVSTSTKRQIVHDDWTQSIPTQLGYEDVLEAVRQYEERGGGRPTGGSGSQQ